MKKFYVRQAKYSQSTASNNEIQVILIAEITHFDFLGQIRKSDKLVTLPTISMYFSFCLPCIWKSPNISFDYLKKIKTKKRSGHYLKKVNQLFNNTE